MLVGGDTGGFVHIAEALADGLRASGLAMPRGAFTPHVTLIYDTAVVPPRDVEAVEWGVGSFALLHSRIGAGRPYEALATWTLAG